MNSKYFTIQSIQMLQSRNKFFSGLYFRRIKTQKLIEMTGSAPHSFATNTLIIGAGAAGLAAAACLGRHRIPCVILEKEQAVGSAWLNRYERLHLHTHSWFSSLPYLSFPRDFPRYPSRLQFADYLASYAKAFDLSPRFGQSVSSVTRPNDHWVTQTQDATYHSQHVVIATGYSHKPRIPSWPGQDSFPGPMLHSSSFVNGASYAGKDVLVVGFGNSAGEIAIDLHEHGAEVSMAVRNPVNIVPRDIFGLSTHIVSVMMSRLPTEVADAMSSNLRNFIVGDVTPYGLEKASIGPMTMIKRESRVPLLDIGTVDLIKNGNIKIYKGIDSFNQSEVTFVDGVKKDFDAVILATGFTTNLDAFLPEANQVVDEKGLIAAGGKESALPGLFFCGLHNAPAGLLRQIGIEARRIAKSIRKKPRNVPQLRSTKEPVSP